MHTATTTTKHVLNDLILINNDRIAGYEKAIAEIKADAFATQNMDLVLLFERLIDESRDFRNALGTEVQALGGEMAEGTMLSGKIYRAWMDVRALFSGSDRYTILSNCEAGEDAASRAYQSALEEEVLPAFLKVMILKQKEQQHRAHDEIKQLRDLCK